MPQPGVGSSMRPGLEHSVGFASHVARPVAVVVDPSYKPVRNNTGIFHDGFTVYSTLVAIHQVVPPGSVTPPRLSSSSFFVGACTEVAPQSCPWFQSLRGLWVGWSPLLPASERCFLDCFNPWEGFGSVGARWGQRKVSVVPLVSIPERALGRLELHSRWAIPKPQQVSIPERALGRLEPKSHQELWWDIVKSGVWQKSSGVLLLG